MFKSFNDIDSLMQYINDDKIITGIHSATAGRFPVRFIMFDNFPDCYNFVSRLMDKAVVLESVNEWLDPKYPDSILTYSQLSDKICSLVREHERQDFVIAPFSELARFYDNIKSGEFDALVSDIKGIEASEIAFECRQRVYVPIVGLEAKMSRFYNDSQIHIWNVKSSLPQSNYRLILTNGTDYGVKGLENNFSVVNTVMDWLRLWRDQMMKKDIICTSQAIFALSEYAQPDNAFDFITCNSAFDLLTKGLNLKLSFLSDNENTKVYWEQLANEVNITSFDFTNFFNAKFDIHALAGHNIFIKTWFENNSHFDRWLLVSYYTKKFCDQGYICAALKEVKGYTNADLVQALLLSVFDYEIDEAENLLDERQDVLKYVQLKDITLDDTIQRKVVEKLNNIAKKYGYTTALRYISLVTDAEKSVIIDWLGRGYIQRDAIKELYPDLYHYLNRSFGIKDADMQWLLPYFDSYKVGKISNLYSDDVFNAINIHNSDTAKFYSWYNTFSNTRTLLHNRADIDIYFWIDGLGLDWAPYIQHIVNERNKDNYYLNEVLVARAELPTKTDVNKKSLLQLMSGGDLQKSGDLDSISHQCRQFPQYIIDDLKLVRDIINDILDHNPGKKIAIVSDHGISYLSQLLQGFNLPGLTSVHGGRVAIAKKPTLDNRYIILDDNKTLCALRHNSLCAKIHDGSGCHGGCTPEEVLVPIFIISSQPNATTWSAYIDDFEISASNPIVKFKIKGVPFDQTPLVEYNGVEFMLVSGTDDTYFTPHLPLDAFATSILLKIGDKSQSFNLKLDLGTEEEDLFDF